MKIETANVLRGSSDHSEVSLGWFRSVVAGVPKKWRLSGLILVGALSVLMCTRYYVYAVATPRAIELGLEGFQAEHRLEIDADWVLSNQSRSISSTSVRVVPRGASRNEALLVAEEVRAEWRFDYWGPLRWAGLGPLWDGLRSRPARIQIDRVQLVAPRVLVHRDLSRKWNWSFLHREAERLTRDRFSLEGVELRADDMRLTWSESVHEAREGRFLKGSLETHIDSIELLVSSGRGFGSGPGWLDGSFEGRLGEGILSGDGKWRLASNSLEMEMQLDEVNARHVWLDVVELPPDEGRVTGRVVLVGDRGEWTIEAFGECSSCKRTASGGLMSEPIDALVRVEAGSSSLVMTTTRLAIAQSVLSSQRVDLPAYESDTQMAQVPGRAEQAATTEPGKAYVQRGERPVIKVEKQPVRIQAVEEVGRAGGDNVTKLASKFLGDGLGEAAGTMVKDVIGGALTAPDEPKSRLSDVNAPRQDSGGFLVRSGKRLRNLFVGKETAMNQARARELVESGGFSCEWIQTPNSEIAEALRLENRRKCVDFQYRLARDQPNVFFVSCTRGKLLVVDAETPHAVTVAQRKLRDPCDN